MMPTRIQTVKMIRMSGAILPLPLYAFVAWAGKTVLLPLLCEKKFFAGEGGGGAPPLFSYKGARYFTPRLFFIKTSFLPVF